MAHDQFYSIEAILPLLPSDLEGKRILDVGCGCGTVIHKIVSTSGRPWSSFRGMPVVIGIDRDPELVEFARRWMPYYREVFLWDATEVPYPVEVVGESLDVVICTESAEHWLDKARGLEAVKYLSTLAPLVIFTCPSGDQTNRLYEQDYHNHNLVWYPSDFRRLGFEVKLVTQYPKNVELFMRVVKRVATGKPLFRKIIAWRVG